MSVITVIKELYHCKCDDPSCAHEWETDKVPQRCARCKIRTWNRPPRFSSKEPLTYKGETLTIAEWSRRLGFSKNTIPWRLKQKWPIEQVLSGEDWRYQQ